MFKGAQLVVIWYALNYALSCKHICTHSTHIYLLTHTKFSPSLAHKHPCKQTSTQMSHDKLKIPLLPLIMERMQKWPAECSHLSVYKPLKPTLTTNERPVQSVSNPVPIWASLLWASFAFVLWLSEGQACTPQPSSRHLLNMHLAVAVKKDPNQLISSQAGDPPHM